MRLCKVVGTVVATVKHPALHGHTLLAVQPLNAAQEPEGSSFLAIDRVQAGVGDEVLVHSEGNGARQLLGDDHAPIRSLIVGIVDSCDVDSENRSQGIGSRHATD
ncbi:MAG: EutN/CcmL family microcompartment protein [Deltaproteobacteria bacterium]|nr:EutN/CcmL family microcompartment protein [Deltaproteobacteria bacterium]